MFIGKPNKNLPSLAIRNGKKTSYFYISKNCFVTVYAQPKEEMTFPRFRCVSYSEDSAVRHNSAPFPPRPLSFVHATWIFARSCSGPAAQNTYMIDIDNKVCVRAMINSGWALLITSIETRADTFP